jgi:hypothetical protein
MDRSRGSSVGIATGCGLDGQSSIPESWTRFFSTSQGPDRFWDAPSRLPNDYRGVSPGIKQPEREADHSPSTSAEAKSTWISTFTSPYVFME